MKERIITLLLLLSSATLVVAQDPITFVQQQDIPVHTAAGMLPSPWVGGLNSPQFSTIDLNKDGVQDLYAFDRVLKKSFTWLAVEKNGSWNYQYAPAYEALFPETLHEWVLLRDYNCDGLKDIFTSDPLGIRVYKQVVGNNKMPAFELAKEFLTYGAGDFNMQMTRADVPSITDMDGDGDLDILLSEFSRGQNLEYYRNMQVEQGLKCGELKFVLASNWWGNITECNGCNNYVFGASCRVAGPMHSGHEGTSLLLIDVDKDGDKDLLIGGVECDELIVMENKGTAQQARMESMQQVFPTNTRQASFHKFPAAFYEDVTFDGIPDLLLAPSTGHSNGDAISQHSVWLYRNKGETDLPNFEFTKNNFLQDQMIDLGEGAYPAFADVDGDGDLDMLIGNNGSLLDGIFKASISYYHNTGTAREPVFTLVTGDYLNLRAKNLIGIKPAFADVNSDGITDLILTYRLQQTGTNRAVYLHNKAVKGAAMVFNWNDQKGLAPLADGDSPAFLDIDGDGDLDYLVGRANGDLQLYQNTGSVLSPVYVLAIANMGGITADFARSNLYPAITDFDGDDTPDLVTIDNSGILKIYTNFTDKLNTTFTATTSLFYNALTITTKATHFGKGSSVAPVVFGEKGKLRLFIGSLGGGILLLEQTTGNSNQPDTGSGSLTLQVYPNPIARGSQEVVKVRANEPIAFILFDAVGRKVFSSTDGFKRSYNIDLHNLGTGVYIMRAVSKSGQINTFKVVVF